MAIDDLHREYILDHYRSPHNKGDLLQPDKYAAYSNPLCGDRIQMGVQFQDGKVADVRFNGNGCAISQAAASILTDMMLGKTPEELRQISRDDILEMIGPDIGPARQKCALLSLDVLRKGILGEPEAEDEELD